MIHFVKWLDFIPIWLHILYDRHAWAALTQKLLKVRTYLSSIDSELMQVHWWMLFLQLVAKIPIMLIFRSLKNILWTSDKFESVSKIISILWIGNTNLYPLKVHCFFKHQSFHFTTLNSLMCGKFQASADFFFYESSQGFLLCFSCI